MNNDSYNAETKDEIMIVDDNFFNIEILQEIIMIKSPRAYFINCFSGKEALDSLIARVY